MNVVSYLSIETCIVVAKDLWPAIRDEGVSLDVLNLFDRIVERLRSEGYVVRFVAFDREWGDSLRSLVIEEE